MILLVAFISFISIIELKSSTDKVAHTHNIIHKTLTISSKLSQVYEEAFLGKEQGMKEMGDPRILTASVKEDVDSLILLAKDTPSHIEQIKLLQKYVGEYLALAEAYIPHKTDNTIYMASASLDQCNSQIHKIIAAEHKYLISRKFVNRENESKIQYLIMASTVLGIVCLSLLFYFIYKVFRAKSLASQQLQLSERIFSISFTNTGVGMALVSPEGEWLDVNPALCDMLGYSKDELIKLTFQHFSHPDDLKLDLHYLQLTLAGTIDKYAIEKRYLSKQGNYIHTRLYVSLVRENGVPMFFISQIHDISSEKQATEELIRAKEEAEQATIAKTNFLSTMSHEIRTPMNAVINFTHLLLQNAREDQLEYLKMLKFSGENLLVLINDILDYNKIESGKIEFESIDFNLRELLENIKGGLLLEAEDKGIILELFVDSKLPDMVQGDPVRLIQVLTNLVSNAVKFTNKGRVTLSVKLVRASSLGLNINFEVSDTGIGIDKNKHHFIFESFTQASSETTRKFGGTGLGLAITKRLLELQNSSIELESEPGKGSRFYFDLLLKQSKMEKDQRVNRTDEKKSLKGLLVLLVEDNNINVVLARQILKRWDIECDVAENGKIALKMVQEKPYGLVLMDLQMPEMDGYTATKEIRKLPGAQYQQLPIIALTAAVMTEIKEEVLQAGMNDFLAKPFNPDDLYAKISSYHHN